MIPMFSMEAAIDPSGDTDVMLYVVLSLVGLCLEVAAFNKLYNGTMRWLRKRSGGARGQVTYPPNRTQGIVGVVWGGIFVLIGLVVIIPATAPFGIMWTLLAGIFTVLHIYQTFVKRYIEPKVRTWDGRPAPEAKRQLEQLESLRAAGLMTEEEYRRRRDEIMKEP